MGAIRKKPVILANVAARTFCLIRRHHAGTEHQTGTDAFIDGFDIAMFPQGAEGVRPMFRASLKPGRNVR